LWGAVEHRETEGVILNLLQQNTIFGKLVLEGHYVKKNILNLFRRVEDYQEESFVFNRHIRWSVSVSRITDIS
jgi:N-acetylglucosamine-6-phosphate deacetylase